MTSNAQKPLEDIPMDQIEEVMKSGLEDVNIRVLRKNTHNGQIGATGMTGHVISVKDLYHIEELLRDRLGGGTYIVEARHPQEMRPVCQKWYVRIEGIPKPSSDVNVMGNVMMTSHGPVPVPSFMNAVQQQAPMHQMPQGGMTAQSQQQSPAWTPPLDSMGRIMPPPDLPKVYRSFPVLEQWAIYEHLGGKQNQQAGAQPPVGASMYSDQAMAYAEQNTQRELMAAKSHAARLEEQRVSLERELHSRLEHEKERVRKAELEAEKAKHDAELRALKAEMESWKETSKQQPKQNTIETFATLAAAVAPLVPLFSEMIKGNQLREQLAVQSQQKQMELTVHSLTAGKKNESDWSKIIPAVAPFLLQMLENRSPQALAEAQSLQMESNIALTQFVSQLVKEHQGPDQPWWMPMVQNILGTVQQHVAMKAGVGGIPMSLPEGEDENQAGHEQQHQVAHAIPTQPADEWSRLAQIDQRAALITKEIFKQLQPSLGFHTREWKLIMFNLHLRKSPPEELAQVLQEQLIYCRRYGTLPAILANVFVDPAPTLQRILGMLPVAKEDPQYIEKIITSISTHLLPNNSSHRPNTDVEFNASTMDNREPVKYVDGTENQIEEAEAELIQQEGVSPA